MPYRPQSRSDRGDGQTQGMPTLMSITEKMANMQSTYDQNARPIVHTSKNGSSSNFKAEDLQVEDSNVKVLQSKEIQNQSHHALKDVI